jgi:hypothetical protein
LRAVYCSAIAVAPVSITGEIRSDSLENAASCQSVSSSAADERGKVVSEAELLIPEILRRMALLRATWVRVVPAASPGQHLSCSLFLVSTRRRLGIALSGTHRFAPP